MIKLDANARLQVRKSGISFSIVGWEQEWGLLLWAPARVPPDSPPKQQCRTATSSLSKTRLLLVSSIICTRLPLLTGPKVTAIWRHILRMRGEPRKRPPLPCTRQTNLEEAHLSLGTPTHQDGQRIEKGNVVLSHRQSHGALWTSGGTRVGSVPQSGQTEGEPWCDRTRIIIIN